MAKAYVVGTFDTKGDELRYVAGLIEAAGVDTVTVDLSTTGGDPAGERSGDSADVSPAEVAACHPDGAAAVFTGDRGSAVGAMAAAFARFLAGRPDVGGVIGLGGSGGTALVTPAMQELPVGIPKVMVSTLASGDVSAYVGPSDIAMVHSVTDVAGLNRISRRVLGNAAHALAGMVARPVADPDGGAAAGRPALGLTMFGVTTPCVSQITELLAGDYDCLVFHATGTGGRSMEKLVDSGLIEAVIDVTTTEVCDHLLGGVLSAGPDRLGAIARTGVPYVGSCGALDMVNFGGAATVPERYQARNLYVHNPQVTLMRTTPEENSRIGEWIGEKLNACNGPVRFLIPEGGVSAIDAPGAPFHDEAADKALFDALTATVNETADRRLVRLPHHINDPEFAAAVVAAFRELTTVA